MMTVKLTFVKYYQLELTQDLNDVMIMYCMLPPVESLGSDRKVCLCVRVCVCVCVYTHIDIYMYIYIYVYIYTFIYI